MREDAPNNTPSAIAGLLEAGLAELRLAVSTPQLDTLVRFTGAVAEWGQHLNLTGHRDPETIARRLVLDAAGLSTVLPEVTSLNDLGSGAGFPGIPLAILRPDCRVHLVESRERRHHFLREMARSLRLPDLSVERGRIEALKARPRACAIAQAVGPAAQVLEWILPWAEEDGGWLAIPASTSSPDLADSRLGAPVVREYAVPLGGPARKLWLARRSEGLR